MTDNEKEIEKVFKYGGTLHFGRKRGAIAFNNKDRKSVVMIGPLEGEA